MKNIIYFLLLTAAISSCQSNKNELTKQKDYSFLTDSLKIDKQLESYKLSGFSLVVFENYEIVYSNQFGLKLANSDEKIDGKTAFSTASISKPITALLCFILEEKGLIDLDEPIDNYLKRWHLPKSQFTEIKNPTWKQFLNHTAGTSQHGFADFYEGDTIPTIKQSLLGELPRYDKEIEFLFTPGTSWSYSGGGYVIVQMALEDTLNKSIAELADEYIFSPLDLKNTTMIQPNQKGFLTNVALVHDKDNKVIKTGLPITPQVAPSGLWSTPTDLAKLTIEIQNALRNKENKVISHNVAKNVIEVTALKDAVGGWSYGWQRSFGFDNYDWFMCNGSNTGVGGDIFATTTDGNGFVFLANGEKPNRFPVIDETRKNLLTLLNWKRELPKEETQEIPNELKENLKGNYEDFLYGQGMPTKIIQRNNRLYVESPFFEHFKGQKDSEMVYLKNGIFKIIDYPNFLTFNIKDEKPNSVILTRDNLNVEIQLNPSEK
ncbi:CubicO group peptidase (beta-lactamase class C family) [Tenacibaculum adriaticum]|uniref:CubicO group peptidase (Beta-lactamase class C family) n=1 Tax=Tenacibaculum adriaticum TaxID=413713 RepID=A0A5S5DN10_9FLAO|nr:serine hydrolase domain-containing protein [Tenacibaculum adriaticum]TYP96436.1 CubicO group peptidase (beta-lactamase class C family) [Tenacibaculum adriaticum]